MGALTVMWNVFVVGLALYFHDAIGLPDLWKPIGALV